MLNSEERDRYRRQMLLPGFGVEAQERLKEARVLVAGMGGLGCPSALYLTAAGVGEIVLVDDDRVARNNLNRQILYDVGDIGEPKVFSAAKRLERLNPNVRIVPLKTRLEPHNMAGMVEGNTVVIDALDNFQTRYALNRTCVEHRIPMIYGGIHGMTGMVSWIIPGRTSCLSCLFPEPPEAGEFPVLGTVPGLVALIQVTETVKFITGMGELSAGRLLTFDGASMEFFSIETRADPNCPVCGGASGIDAV